MTERPSLPQSIMAGLAGRCPRCRKGPLFSGFLNLRKQCDACGLDYSFADAGDGPAIFVILISKIAGPSPARSEEHTSELQSHSDLHSFPTRRSSDLQAVRRVRSRLFLPRCGRRPGDLRDPDLEDRRAVAR